MDPAGKKTRVVIVGGGAAGFFAAIRCAEAAPDVEVILLEKSRKLLAKVGVSGGGRCNVTHACFDPRDLCAYYPRGHRELLGPFHQWNPTHTVQWFEERGVELKTEADGRMFPVTNSSQTIIDCLTHTAAAHSVAIWTECGLRDARWDATASCFELTLTNDRTLRCDRLMLATGGNRQSIGYQLAERFGHQILAPVPSLFTFHIEAPLLKELSGITVTPVETQVVGSKVPPQTGPLLITHWGVSGPATLKLSAWAARELAACAYTFTLRINWLPNQKPSEVENHLAELRRKQGGQPVVKKSPFAPIPRRLWERMVQLADISPETTWSQLAKSAGSHLVDTLTHTQLPVTGKSMNKEEFVTCGGVLLKEVNMKTMESRKQPGLHFAGEVLDIDGVTGGFNFQAAWTGGYLAGTAMAQAASAL